MFESSAFQMMSQSILMFLFGMEKKVEKKERIL